jgi:hypothetical protein
MTKIYSFHIVYSFSCLLLIKTKTFCFCLAAFCFVLATDAQTSNSEFLQQQFDAYSQNSLQEKLYMHSDKDVYLAGEICWFKIYNVDAFFHRPLDLSKIAYVELLDKNNKSILQAKIPLKEACGNGSLHFPVLIESGKYKLRAYTNWMKNFSADYFFEKVITVINSRKIYEGDVAPRNERYDLNLFPEGGNLVNGIESKVAFSISEQGGKGVLAEGVVVNDKADTVVKFNTFKFGIGSFLFTPEKGRLYKAVVRLPNGDGITRELPIASNEGYVMRLITEEDNQIKVTIGSSINNTAPIYLFTHTRGIIKSVLKSDVNNGFATFLVEKNKLGNGISHLTVFNNKRQPVCERLFFKYPEEMVMLDIKTEKPAYKVREKINININATNRNGSVENANMSMAVYRIDSLQELDEMNINNYLWLSSDLMGTIESPGYYFGSNDSTVKQAMDNLMLTHGWRRFKWEDVVKNNRPVFEFVPECNGHIIKARITKTGTGLAGNEITGFLSVPSTKTQFRIATSNANGFVQFDMKDFYNQGEIIVQTNSNLDSFYSIEIFNPFSLKYSNKHFPAFSLLQTNSGALLKHHISTQIQNTYLSDKVKQFVYPAVDTNAFYVKPDATYILDNYVRFTSIEEVLREYVSQVNVRRRDGQFHLPVADALRKRFFESDPLLLLDGVPIFDINKFMNYDPLKIRKLEVMGRQYYLGNMYYEGIANFVTYKGNLEGYELDPHATVIDYEGLQLQREFFSPSYETEQQLTTRLPDFRQLLYWSPNINTNEKGWQHTSFYSSDQSGQYVVILQALSDNGKTGYKAISFEVKDIKSDL